MTARTFGRKGAGGAVASRRAAFIAGERTSADRGAETEVFPATVRPVLTKESVEASTRAVAPVREARPVGPRSLPLAYGLWLVLGTAGAHRLYLGRILSGAVQALLCGGCFAAVTMQYYQAFPGLAICWLWMFVDGFQLKKMHAEATAPAETCA